MSTLVKGSFIQVNTNYEVKEHPQSERLYNIKMKQEAVENFLTEIKQKDISVQRLEYTPYERLIVADMLERHIGDNFGSVIREIIHDRETGGFTLGLEGVSKDTDDYVIFATAITHHLGLPNFDAMSGKYYARFEVRDTDNSDSYLRQAYRLFTLHTDGTFVDEPTDWLLMMKMVEENAVGGESRLLHLDDWKGLDTFYDHPLAKHKFTYIAPPSKNVSRTVDRPTFFKHNDKPCICYIDQFVNPETVEEAKYLRDLSESMENDEAVIELELPVGDLVVINNLFWLHGRAAFEKHKDLNRELMRQRGHFVQ